MFPHYLTCLQPPVAALRTVALCYSSSARRHACGDLHWLHSRDPLPSDGLRARSAHSRSPDMSNRVAMLSQMLTVFTNALPAIDALDGIAPGEAIALVNPDMVCAHMDIYAVTMLLMNSQMQMRGDPVSYDRMYKSACAIASICRHLRSSGRLEMIYASGGFEFGLHVACEVLLRDLLQMNGGPSSLEVERRAVMTQQSLEMLYSFEAELNPHFPSRKSLVRKIRGILSGTASFEILLS
ncbi:hypothetical protein DL93DRAFT_1520830 [Clavulina sp. PMI_390]|nr:hypothetical protein DL93DRAFT_1520830 [Clavulina sp. PMI_390]